MKEWFISNIIGNYNLVIAFFLSQLVNVILSTIKSVLTIKGTRLTAVIISTVSYTINALIVSLIGKVDDIITICLVTAITNIIGVSFSLWLLDKLRKDRLWRYSISVDSDKVDMFKIDLTDNNLKFINIGSDWDKMKLIDIFAYSKQESIIVKKLISKYKAKYTVVEPKGNS